MCGILLGGWFGWSSRDEVNRLVCDFSWTPVPFTKLLLIAAASFLFYLLLIVLRSRFLSAAILVLEGIAFGAVLIGLYFIKLEYGWLLASVLLLPRMSLLIPQFLVCYRSFQNVFYTSFLLFFVFLLTLVAFTCFIHLQLASFVRVSFDCLVKGFAELCWILFRPTKITCPR